MPEKIIGFPPEKRVAMSGKESIERIKNIPAILTSLRKSKQFTQQEVAQVLNLSVETIIKIENGEKKVKVSDVVKYGEFFGISGRDLFNEKYIEKYIPNDTQI